METISANPEPSDGSVTAFNEIADDKHIAVEIRQLLDQRDFLQQQLFESHYETLFMMAISVDQREGHLGLHVLATGIFSHRIAIELGLSNAEAHSIVLAAPLCDIGKIGLSDDVLVKTSPWTPDEWNLYREHPITGANMLAAFTDNTVFRMAWEIAKSHHENINGSGYPDRLRGEAIPITARIVRAVDGYLTHTHYQPGSSHSANGNSLDLPMKGLQDMAGYRYDSDVVAAFARIAPSLTHEYNTLITHRPSLLRIMRSVKQTLAAENLSQLH